MVEFACLFFDADDRVCFADTCRVAMKTDAIAWATDVMESTPGAVGFQLWCNGVKVAQHIGSSDERDGANAGRPFRARIGTLM